MSNLSGGSNDRLPAKDTRGPSLLNEPAVTLADFRFQKIGHPPALLQRMLASGSNTENSQRLHAESRSPSPDLEDELLLSDSSPEALNHGLPLNMNNGQPSLRARIAMSEQPIESSDNMDVDIPNQIQNYDSSTNSLRGADGKSTGPSAARKPSTLTPLPNTTTSSENANGYPIGSVATTLNGPSPFSGPSSIQGVQSSSQPAIHRTDLSGPSTFSETSTLKSLRDLQSLLSSSNLNSPSNDIANAMRLGQTIKDQSIDMISASRNAHTLAQQSIASAQESLGASLRSIAIAESLQTRTDELVAAIKRMDSGRNEEWRNAIAPFATRLTELVKDVKDQEISNAEARRQTEREKKAAETQERTKSQHSSPVDHEVDEIGNPPIANSASRAVAEDAFSRIERETTVVNEELIRKREEAEARQRAAEVALRQRREAEDLLERQRQQAQAELERLEEEFKQAQTERMEAEEKERLRQEEEIRIMRMEEEEKQRKEKQAAELAIEERNKRAALKLQKQQAQQDKLAREAALRERLEKEKLARDQDAKKLQAKEDEKDRFRQQELKRQEIRDQKIRANLEAAKKIQATRARNVQESSKSDLQTSQTALANSSASVLSRVADVPSESGPSMSGGNVPVAAGRHTTSLEARSSHAIAPPMTNSPPEQATSYSSSIPLKHLPSSSKSRLSIGLPSPPLEENKLAQDDIVDDRVRSIAETSALGIRRSHEPISGNQTYHTANVGSAVIQPQRSTSPSKHSRSFAAVETEEASAENKRHRMAEPSRISRSHTSPTSPNARKSNSRKHSIKSELEENKLADIKSTSNPVKDEPMSDHDEAITKTETPARKLKTESPSDYHIPPLSMPSPSPDHGHSHDENLPALPVSEREIHKQRLPVSKRHILDPVEESSLGSRTNLPLLGRYHAPNDRPIPTKVFRQDIQPSTSSVALPSQSGSGSRVISSSLPVKPPPMFQAPVQHGAIFNTDFDDRMGPDAAVPDNLFPPFHPGPMEEDLPEQRRRRMPPRVDHYSPSPPPPLNSVNRVVPARTRRGDHYSPPRRSPEPRRSYGVSRTSPGPSWNRQRGPNSGSNSRDVSPGPPAQSRAPQNIRRSPSPERNPQIGRKRNRETQDTVGPPSNRPRLGYTDNNYPQNRWNPIGPDPRHHFEDDWSRTANYGRSPSPEPRLTPLQFRLDEAPNSHPVRLPVQRPEANPYSDQPRRRDAGSYAHIASSSSDVKLNPPNNTQRQNTGDKPDGSRPHLLDRFTDLPMGVQPSIPSEPSHNYNKGPRYRKQTYQRPNVPQQQPLEQRLNDKKSLINRLQQQ